MEFLAYILVPSTTKDVEAAVERLTKQYYDWFEVEPYEAECKCVKDWPLYRARDLTEAGIGTRDEMRKAFVSGAFPELSALDKGEAWKFLLGIRDRIYMRLFRRFYELRIPYPDCEECKGTGVGTSTFNTKCRFDSLEIGDDDGGILSPATKDPSGLAQGAAMAPVNSLDVTRIRMPDVIVTSAGEWYEQDGPCYADEDNLVENEDWETTFKRLLEDHVDALLVVARGYR